MSLLAPATAPVSDAGILILSPTLQPPSPDNDNITPPPAPTITLPLSTPPLIAPTLPIVVVGDTPTLSPTSQPPPPPSPQPQSQPPLTPPPSVTKNILPPKRTNPPKSISPTFSKPINIDSPPPTIITTPPPTSSQRPRTRPIIEISPSQPPQVPQSPSDNDSLIPFSTESPTPLPILPGTPGTFSSPASPLHDSTTTPSSPSSSSPSSSSPSPSSSSPSLPSSFSASLSARDHQYLQAIAVDPKGADNGANNNSFVVGLAIGGILLLLLATVFGILLVFCKRRHKKNVGDNESIRKYCEFEDKSSLPHYTKQESNNHLGHHTVINNVSTPKGPNIATNGTPQVNVGPTLGTTPSFSSGTFTYEELSRATNGFSKHNLLGQGGFGYVHKGVLENGKEVAVKQLMTGGPQVEREFRAEIETISQVHHKHLVSLVGYCIAGVERLLVYEFVPNNTLEFHLHGNRKPVMDWPTRLKIAIGSAKGFAYLHEDCSPSIIHRDIKAANILLDFNFEAKVSDFGLAKILSSTNPSATHITTRIVGTFGYLAPEYASSGKVTDKSDVYSYGVMLLELITGRPPISNFESSRTRSLVDWARPLLAQAIGDGKFDRLADPKLRNKYKVDEMASMVACAAACVHLSACHRPRMSQVVRSLEGNLPTSELLDDGTRPGQSPSHFPYESLLDIY